MNHQVRSHNQNHQREADKEAEKELREAEKDNPSENGFENGDGLGKIPPGLAKLFGYDDGTGDNKDFEAPEGLPPGFGAGVVEADKEAEKELREAEKEAEKELREAEKEAEKELREAEKELREAEKEATRALYDKPDDYYENHYEGSIDDYYEELFDGTNRGYLDGKGLFGALPWKSGGGDLKAEGEERKSTCVKGFTDAESTLTSGTKGVEYIVKGFTAIGDNCKDSTSEIKIRIEKPNQDGPFDTDQKQPYSFTPDEAGIWEILVKAEGVTGTRIVNVVLVGTAPTANAGPDQTGGLAVVELSDVTLTGIASTDIEDDDASIDLTYSWVKLSDPGGETLFGFPVSGSISPTFTFTTVNVGGSTTYTFTLTVTDSDGNSSTDDVLLTVNDSPPNSPPTANAGPDQPTVIEKYAAGVDVMLDGSASSDSETASVDLIYSWVQTEGITVPPINLIGANTATPSFETLVGVNTNYQFELTVTDSGGLTAKDKVTIKVKGD